MDKDTEKTEDVLIDDEAAARQAQPDGEELLDITDFIREQKTLRTRERRMRDLELFGLRALIFIVIVWALFYLIIGFATMPGDDMYPRIDGGDLLMFYRLDREPVAQDVIVISKGGERVIARVVAIPGDTVEVTERDTLVINGSTMIESNIFYSTPRYDNGVEYPLTLGPGEYFVLADKREGGMDSRWFGPVTEDEIAGTVITIMRRNHL